MFDRDISENDYLDEMLKGTGRTTDLLKNCLPKAVFIVSSASNIDSVRLIANSINRNDINIISLESVKRGLLYGVTNISEIVCDHSIITNKETWDKIYCLKGYYSNKIKSKIVKIFKD